MPNKIIATIFILAILVKSQPYSYAQAPEYVFINENVGVGIFKEGLAVVRENAFLGFDGKYGFVDINYNFVIQPQFDFAKDFSEGYAAVTNYDKTYYIDKTGKKVIDLDLHSAGSFKNGLAIVGKNDKYGIIDTKGNLIKPLIFDHISSFPNWKNLFEAKKNGKYGMIDEYGTTKIDFKYDMLLFGGHDEDRITYIIRSTPNEIMGFLDINGKEYLFPSKYKSTESCNYGLCPVKGINGKWGAINKNFEEVIPLMYDLLMVEADIELLFAKYQGKFGYINRQNQIVIPFEFDGGKGYSEGFFALRKKDKYGLYKSNGKVLLYPEWFSCSSFKEGISNVCWNKGFGNLGCKYINTSGTVQIPMEFISCGEFYRGIAKVSRNGEDYYYIDKTGRCVMDCKNDTEWSSKNSIYRQKNQEGEKIINSNCGCTNPKFVENNDLIGPQDNHLIKFDNFYESSNIKFENGKYLHFTGLGLNPDVYKSYSELVENVTKDCQRVKCRN